MLADDPGEVQKNGGNSSLGGSGLFELIGHSADNEEGRAGRDQRGNEKDDRGRIQGNNSSTGEMLTYFTAPGTSSFASSIPRSQKIRFVERKLAQAKKSLRANRTHLGAAIA